MPAKKKKQASSEKKELVKKDAPKSIKKDKALLIVGLGVILLFIVVIFGANLIPKLINNPQPVIPEVKVYKGITFQKVGDIWLTKITVGNKNTNQTMAYEIMFHFTPDEVENITTTVTSKNESVAFVVLAMTKTIYITFDPDESKTTKSMIALGGFEITKILASVYGKDVKSAVTKDINLTNINIVDCNNVSVSTSVVYIKTGNRTGIFFDNGCILVEAEKPEDILRVSERLSFELLKLL